MKELQKILTERNITDYDITDAHYGNALVDKKWVKLKKVIIYDRFFHDAIDLNRLGYGPVFVQRGK